MVEASLSIMVPYWGPASFMIEVVESVLKQDSDRWRLTIIDDAYPDPAFSEWISKIDDSRITYIRNDKNVGIVGNYHKCIELASEKYMMFMGCDDVLMPNYVGRILADFEQFPEASMIQPNTSMIDENGKPTFTLADFVKKYIVMPKARGGRRLVSGQKLATSLLNGDWMYWPSLAFKTEAVRQMRFDADLKYTHDLMFVLDQVFSGHKMLLDAEKSFIYRRHRSSASAASLFDGRRFADERLCFSSAKRKSDQLGWKRASFAASVSITSRLHAVHIILVKLAKFSFSSVGRLLAHALLPWQEFKRV